MAFAFIFESVGAGEWVVLLAVLLVVMGPKRLPSTLRKFGSYYAKFRRAAESFKRQLLEMDTEIQREFSKVEEEVDAAARAAEREVEDAAQAADVGTASCETTAPDAVKAPDGAKASDDGDQAAPEP